MKAYIIDDEHANLEILHILVQKHCPEITIIGESDNPHSFLENKQALENIDLLFLDILMPDHTGFDLLNRLKKRTFEVILVTGFEQFALQAFEHSVIDYVLKPIDKDRFCAAVQKAQKRFAEKELLSHLKTHTYRQAKIPIIKNNKTHYIESQNVAYMIGQSGGYTTIFCQNGESYVISKSLSCIENEYLEKTHLVRANQSTIINLKDIVISDKGGSGYVGLKTNQFEVFLSRRKKREVLQQVELYLKSQS